MDLRWGLICLSITACLVLTSALPKNMVEEIKANELSSNKVKRARNDFSLGEERTRDSTTYGQLTAIKRGANQKTTNVDQPSAGDWDQERSVYQNQDGFPGLQSTLYTNGDNEYDDKSIAEYEKGFRYGTNKDKLDEALENAVLKSEMYGEPSAINQYRYYGAADDKRRKRRDAKKMRLTSRFKRDIELTPEDILTILTLYENERQLPPSGYRTFWQRFQPNLDLDGDRDENDIEQDDESWLDTPVYPHAGHPNHINPGLFYEEKPQVYDKRSQWGGIADSKKKRFMVARKRSDPTHELRYLNGPNKNDFYTLSQLLSYQREPNVPLHHRLVL